MAELNVEDNIDDIADIELTKVETARVEITNANDTLADQVEKLTMVVDKLEKLDEMQNGMQNAVHNELIPGCCNELTDKSTDKPVEFIYNHRVIQCACKDWRTCNCEEKNLEFINEEADWFMRRFAGEERSKEIIKDIFRLGQIQHTFQRRIEDIVKDISKRVDTLILKQAAVVNKDTAKKYTFVQQQKKDKLNLEFQPSI
jgi:hypothetical protein